MCHAHGLAGRMPARAGWKPALPKARGLGSGRLTTFEVPGGAPDTATGAVALPKARGGERVSSDDV